MQKKPREKKSQALHQANFAIFYKISDSVSLWIITIAPIGWGLLCCTYIAQCVSVILLSFGGWEAWVARAGQGRDGEKVLLKKNTIPQME